MSLHEDDEIFEVDFDNDAIFEIEKEETVIDYTQLIINDQQVYGYISNLIMSNIKQGNHDVLRYRIDKTIKNYIDMCFNRDTSRVKDFSNQLMITPITLYPVVSITKRIFTDEMKNMVIRYDVENVIDENERSKGTTKFVKAFNSTKMGIESYAKYGDKHFNALCPFEQQNGTTVLSRDKDVVYVWEKDGEFIFEHLRAISPITLGLPGSENQFQKYEWYQGDWLDCKGFFNIVNPALKSKIFNVNKYLEHLQEINVKDIVSVELYDFIDKTSDVVSTTGKVTSKKNDVLIIKLDTIDASIRFHLKEYTSNTCFVYKDGYSGYKYNKVHLVNSNIYFPNVSSTLAVTFCELTPRQHLYALLKGTIVNGLGPSNLLSLDSFYNSIPNFDQSPLINRYINVHIRKHIPYLRSKRSRQFKPKVFSSNLQNRNLPFFLRDVSVYNRFSFDSAYSRTKWIMENYRDHVAMLEHIRGLQLSYFGSKEDKLINVNNTIYNNSRTETLGNKLDVSKFARIYHSYVEFMNDDASKYKKNIALLVVKLDSPFAFTQVLVKNKTKWIPDPSHDLSLQKPAFRPLSVLSQIAKYSTTNAQISETIEQLKIQGTLHKVTPQSIMTYVEETDYSVFQGKKNDEEITEEVAEFGVNYHVLEDDTEQLDQHKHEVIDSFDSQIDKIIKSLMNITKIRLTSAQIKMITTTLEDLMDQTIIKTKISELVVLYTKTKDKSIRSQINYYTSLLTNKDVQTTTTVFWCTAFFVIFIQLAHPKSIMNLDPSIDVNCFPLSDTTVLSANSLISYMSLLIHELSIETVRVINDDSTTVEQVSSRLMQAIKDILGQKKKLNNDLMEKRTFLGIQMRHKRETMLHKQYSVWSSFRPVLQMIDPSKLLLDKFNYRDEYFASYFTALITSQLSNKSKYMNEIINQDTSFWNGLMSQETFATHFQNIKYWKFQLPSFIQYYGSKNKNKAKLNDPKPQLAKVNFQRYQYTVPQNQNMSVSPTIASSVQTFMYENPIFENDNWLLQAIQVGYNNDQFWSDLSAFVDNVFNQLSNILFPNSLKASNVIQQLKHQMLHNDEKDQIQLLNAVHSTFYYVFDVCGKLLGDYKLSSDMFKNKKHIDVDVRNKIFEVRQNNEFFNLQIIVQNTDVPTSFYVKLGNMLKKSLDRIDVLHVPYAPLSQKYMYLNIYVLLKYLFCIMSTDYETEDVFSINTIENEFKRQLILFLCQGILKKHKDNIINVTSIEEEFEAKRESKKHVIMTTFKGMDKDVRKMVKQLMDLQVYNKDDIVANFEKELEFMSNEDADDVDIVNKDQIDLNENDDIIKDEDGDEDDDNYDYEIAD